MSEIDSFGTLLTFSLPAAGLFSPSRLWSTQGTRVENKYLANFGPGRAPWRVLWTFKSVPRAGSFLLGSLSAEPEQSKTTETPATK